MTHNSSEIKEVLIIYTDIVKYSIRSTSQQEKIILIFTEIVKDVLDRELKTNSNLKDNIILIPTGDGMAIGLTGDQNIKLNLKFIEEILIKIEDNNSSIYCEVFLDKGWCHCHSSFYIRIGVSDGKAIIYSDINGNKNIAGIPINQAARVMGLADGKQVIFSESAYKTIFEFSEFAEIQNNFSKHEDIEVKHGIKLNVYQYLGKGNHIDNSMPGPIDRQKYNVNSFNKNSFVDFSDTAIEIARHFDIKDQLYILTHDTRWVFLLLPSIVYARMKNKQIRVLCPPSDHNYEKQRVALLVRLGCEVKYFNMEDFKFPEIFIFDPNVQHYERAIIFRSDNIYSSRPFATFYDRGYDKDAISIFNNTYENIWNSGKLIEAPNKNFQINVYNTDNLVKKLRNSVHQYSGESIEISLEEISLDSIYYLVNRLYEWKLIQASNILKLYSNCSAELFVPLNLEFEENKFSVITPPVIEVHNGKYVVLNGSHRIYYCRKNGIASMVKCIIVRGLLPSLPGIPIPYERITIDQADNSAIPRVTNFNFTNFRHIESGIHPLNEVML